MGNSITGKEYTLEKIFSQDFNYHIPSYQRPYSWTEDEAKELFDDLYCFYLTEKDDNYFLGSIVLIKEENKPLSQVIDGQQRLTTLTILFSCLATKLNGKLRDTIEHYIFEPGNPLTGLKYQPRMCLRSKDQSFFEQYIQNIRISDLLKLDSTSFKTEAQYHIQKNAEVFINRINEYLNDEQAVVNFCGFLITRCYLVAVSTPSQQSAFRVFSVMNSRGMDLLPIDIIKSDIIGQMNSSEQEEYTEKWENLEVLTGRAGFNEVFTHTRMIFAKVKAKKSLLEEFRSEVLTKTTPKQLIDDILCPYCEAYSIIKKKNYLAIANADKVNNILMWLNKIDNSDWMPSAIKFFAGHKNDSEYILWFVKKLERLCAYQLISGKDINERIERYKWVLDEMDRNPHTSLDNPLKTIELTNVEIQDFITKLNDDIYRLTPRKRNYFILRLDSFVSDGAASYDPNVLTIEHVLPQTVKHNSEWDTLWPNEEQRLFWLNKIANLVPLTRQHNSSAQNFDFEEKKEKYFKNKNKTSSYALTTQVLNVSQWTVQEVENRQKYLIDVFVKNWELVLDDKEDMIPVFHLSIRGSSASGIRSNEGFKVLKDSKIAEDETSSLQENYRVLRKELAIQGVIKNNVFTKDYEFESVSQASSVVSGRSSNGRTEWSTIDGKTYSEIYGK